MTRKIVYSISLWVFLATTGMTLASLLVPEWVSWTTETGTQKQIHRSYGLHRKCDSISATCTPFPRSQDCHGPEASFCALWKSTSFLVSLSFLFEIVTLLALLITLFGSKTRLQHGWRVVVILLTLSAATQIAAMGIVSYLFEYDDRFSIPGWSLDKGWGLCTASWVIQVLCGLAVVVAAAVMGEDGGYELIRESGIGASRERGRYD